MGAIGDLQAYTVYQAANSLGKIADNPGGQAGSVVGMGLAAAGLLPPVSGAVAQEVIDLVAVLNALRASRPGGALSDYE